MFLLFQPPSHSESSLAVGSSEVSLQTMLEEGINFSVPPHRDLFLPQPPLCPVPDETLPSSVLSRRLHLDQTSFTLQATRGRQRSQSSCDSSPSCNRLNSIEPSDDDTGIGGGSSQAFNSEHLSETISSLSLSSLLTPGSLAPPLAKKCNSTGSLEQGNVLARNKNGRHLHSTDQHQDLSNPWTEETDGRDGEKGIAGFGVKSSSQTMDTSSRKNRWNVLIVVFFLFSIAYLLRAGLLLVFHSWHVGVLCSPDGQVKLTRTGGQEVAEFQKKS